MGRAVIVTGASAGIGLGIALKFLNEGDDVVLVGRSLDRLKSAIPEIFEAKGKALFLAQDVSTLEGCKAIIEEGVKLLGGRLDALVNNAGAYSVSKAAVDMLTKASALELAPKGVRVNAINPGTVQTGIFTTAGFTQEQAAAYMVKSAGVTPLGRVGTPEDVAELCYFLTDKAKSGWLTGQCIVLDGGKLIPIIGPK
ncbi:NAD(P)-binding protein [Coccomyxa subellipsoidea C-169]|uniref:NAD(P)-binding protein n=1 Tax=Coccomyxa subellipsoidea (strain C-169) TaxID=574566 RepID=I0YY63_COCSC|nr:NAD(P)-binding protein [Coccomyxa subellipsoidea C-169]EIE23332.1 NAD(P)-binding protein [Coccomyxa subellipsoidea C-169]|eukprot:XP_005647876.1 NAD(P)-binding protein [Coccomyxa subellipsoidea C-169]